jgi:glycine/D-amino acid oxidase-like deaminating enzyme
MPDVVVVGGGIAGCTVAFELARRGARVCLLERRSIGEAASGRNTGTLLQQAEPEVSQLLRESVEAYKELADGPISFGLQERTQLLLAFDEPQLEKSRVRAEAISRMGGRVEAASAEELRRTIPKLGPDVTGGYLVQGAWTVDARQATAAFAYASLGAGVDVRTGVEVVGFAGQRERIEGVMTDQGRIDADATIVATGPWLSDLMGSVPVSAGRGWLMRTEPLGFDLPWLIEEISWPDQEEVGRAVRLPTLEDIARGNYHRPVLEAFVLVPQASGGALLGASLAPTLREAVESVDMPQRLAARAMRFSGALSSVAIRSAWYAHRPMTPDGLPMVGATHREGLYVHGGHGSLGMQSAPATAKQLASHILNSSPVAPWLDVARFSSAS